MKKRLSLLVTLVMLVTTLLPSFSVNAAFSDVDDNNRYKQAITTLSALKVINGYDDGSFQPEKEISRAEFTKMVVYMLGLDNLNTPITTFNDVALDHWANANIKTAYDLGIVNGFDEVTFMPDAPVTYEQALKMLVCTLGYQAFAEANGGYPQGYINQASVLNLTDKITGLPYSSNASRGAIAQMMYNALEVDMYELVNGKWQSSEKNLLNDYLNVTGLKCTVVGVEESTTTDCKASLSKGQMAVKDVVTGTEYVLDFSEHELTAAQMATNLGKTVQVYYRKDRASDDKWLVEISSDMYKNDELTINSNLLDSYEGSTVRYYANDKAAKTSSVRLDLDELAVRYNGRAVEGNVNIGGVNYSVANALAQWLDPDSDNFINGTVKFINNSTGSSYNMVDIYNYQTIVAQKAVSSSDYRITDKTISGNSLVLDPDSSTYTYTILKNGSEIAPTNISANDVINYAVSLDGSYYTVLVTSKQVSGKITGTNLSSSTKTITVGETKYPVTDRFMTYMATKEQREVTAGLQITAYLDAFGSIEWGTITSSAKYYPYAYLIDVESDVDNYYLKLFAPENTSISSLSSSTSYAVKTFKLASGAKLDGKKASGSDIIEALADSQDETDKSIADENYTGYNQFIRVSFTSSGELDNIVRCSNPGTTNNDPGLLVKYNDLDSDPYKVTKTSVKTNNDTVAIRTSTPLFVIPADRTDTDSYMLKGAVNSGSMTEGNSYYVEAFDVNTSKYATFLAIYAGDIQSGTPITSDTRHTLIASDIEQEVDSSTNEIVDVFTAYNNATSLSTVMISDEPKNDFSDLGKGDIILYGLDGKGKADKYELSLDYSDIAKVLKDAASATDGDTAYDWTASKFTSKYPSSGNRTIATMYNVIRVADSSTLHVTRTGFDVTTNENVSSDFETLTISSTKMFRYDEDTEEFTPYAVDTTSTELTLDDLVDADTAGMDCSKIAVLSYYSTSSDTVRPYMIVIYE